MVNNFCRRRVWAGALVLLMLIIFAKGAAAMELKSPAFGHNKMIPRKYTCQGDDINPPLSIKGIPGGTKSLALIVDDPDAPMGMWVHWVVYNIPPSTDTFAEDSVPGNEAMNDFGRIKYGGPCPPTGTHRYFFKIYALDINIPIRSISGKKALESAMQGHILGQAQLIGLYQQSP